MSTAPTAFAESAQDVLIRTLDEELADFDKVMDGTMAKRDHVTKKLLSAVERIKEEDIVDPEIGGSQLAVLNSTLRALNDQEAAVNRRVNAKLKQADQARADNVTDQVTDMLRYISGTRGKEIEDAVEHGIDPDEITQAIDAGLAADDTFKPISEMELRDNPADLSA